MKRLILSLCLIGGIGYLLGTALVLLGTTAGEDEKAAISLPPRLMSKWQKLLQPIR